MPETMSAYSNQLKSYFHSCFHSMFVCGVVVGWVEERARERREKKEHWTYCLYENVTRNDFQACSLFEFVCMPSQQYTTRTKSTDPCHEQVQKKPLCTDATNYFSHWHTKTRSDIIRWYGFFLVAVRFPILFHFLAKLFFSCRLQLWCMLICRMCMKFGIFHRIQWYSLFVMGVHWWNFFWGSVWLLYWRKNAVHERVWNKSDEWL